MNEQRTLDQLIEKTKLNLVSELNKIKELEISQKGSGSSVAKMYDATIKISTSTDQINIIMEMLTGINNFCDRTAIFLIKEDKLKGWGGAGFSKENSDITDKEVKKIFFSLTANTVFKEVLKTKKT